MASPTQFRLALQVYKWQAFAAVALALILLLVRRPWGLSFIYGASVILLGSGFLTWRVYQKHKTLQALPMLWGFLGGEFGKYCIIILFTIILAIYVKMNWLFYALGLVLPQVLGVIMYVLVTKGK